MENIMSTIGLSVDKLPQAGVANLATLSSIALTLDTHDTSLTRYATTPAAVFSGFVRGAWCNADALRLAATLVSRISMTNF
jgi:hypothetical protein